MTKNTDKRLLSFILVLVMFVVSFQAVIHVSSASSDNSYEEHTKNTVTWQMIKDGEYYYKDGSNYYKLTASTMNIVSYVNSDTYYLSALGKSNKNKLTKDYAWASESTTYSKKDLYAQNNKKYVQQGKDTVSWQDIKSKDYYYSKNYYKLTASTIYVVSYTSGSETYYLRVDKSGTSGSIESNYVWGNANTTYAGGVLYTKGSGGGSESSQPGGSIKDGTYSAESTSSYKKDGQTYKVKVTITISNGNITAFSATAISSNGGSITLTKDNQKYFDKAVEGTSSRTGIKDQVINQNASNYEVDTVSSATKASNLIISALANAVANAGGSSSSTPTTSTQKKSITWYKVNKDGTISYADTNATTSIGYYGQKPIYEGQKPAIAYDENFSYEFLGWSSDKSDTIGVPEGKLETVSDTSPTTYYAIFKKIPHLSYHKRVIKTSDNNYNLTLDVKGQARNITTTNSDNTQKYDVILVVDHSNSMEKDIYTGLKSNVTTSRMANLKTIAENFTSHLFTSKSDSQISIVEFGGLYNIVQDWTGNVNTANSAIRNLKAYSEGTDRNGTNYTAGIYGIGALLNSRNATRKNDPNVQTIVVFLSDGAPTGRYTKLPTLGNKTDNGASYKDSSAAIDIVQAVEAVSNVKNNVNGFYAVALYSGSDDDDANTYLKSLTDAFGVNGSLFRYTNVNDVNENLKDILDNVTTTVPMNPKGIVITDTLSDYVEPTSSTLANATVMRSDSITPLTRGTDYTITYSGKIVTLTLMNELAEGVTYTLTVPIKATSTAISAGQTQYNATGAADTGTYAGQLGFYSNGSATVTYRYGDDDEYKYTLNYQKPVIQVTAVAEPTYKVTYVMDGGTPTITDSKDYKVGDTVTVTGTPTKSNYRFNGWLYDGNTYYSGDTVPMVSGGITFTAQWTPVYTVTYDLNGGSLNGSSANITDTNKYESGTTVTVKSYTPTRNGYTFKGWLKDNAAVGATFTMPNQNVTLKAIWEENTVDDGSSLKLDKQAISTGENTWQLELTAYNRKYVLYNSTGTITTSNNISYSRNTLRALWYQIKGLEGVPQQDIYRFFEDDKKYYQMDYKYAYYLPDSQYEYMIYCYRNGGTSTMVHSTSVDEVVNAERLKTVYVKATESSLDSSAVLKDVISDKFNLTAGATAKAVVQKYNGSAWVTDTTLTNGLTANLTGRTVTVTGFNYKSYPYYGTDTVPLTDDYKIVVTINGITGIQTDSEQTNVETNTSVSGIYKDSTTSEPIAVFPIPTVTIPAETVNYTLTADNIVINLNADGTVKDFTGTTDAGHYPYNQRNDENYAYLIYTFKINGVNQGYTKFVMESDDTTIVKNRTINGGSEYGADNWLYFTGKSGVAHVTLKPVVNGAVLNQVSTTITVTVNKPISVTVQKVVEDTYGDKSKAFSFKYLSPNQSDVKTFTLSNNNSYTIPDLYQGDTLLLKETANSYYTVTVKAGNTEYSVQDDGYYHIPVTDGMMITVTNTRITKYYSISKTVSGNISQSTFEFTLDFSVDGKPYKQTYNILSGCMVGFSFPLGTEVKVTETAGEDYKIQSAVLLGSNLPIQTDSNGNEYFIFTIETGKTSPNITVTNREVTVPLTGLDTDSAAAYIMLGVPLLAAGVYFISLRKKRISSV